MAFQKATDDDPLWRAAMAARQAAQRVFDSARFSGQPAEKK
jgi:hypothetical protein